MNDFQKSCLGTVLSIGLFFVVGLVVICYSLLVAGGTLPPPRPVNMAAMAPAGRTPVSSPRNVATPLTQSPDKGQVASASPVPTSGLKYVAAPLAQASNNGSVAPTSPTPSVSSSSGATPVAQSPGDGQTLFQEKCVSCHTIGGGTLVGPDLEGVMTRRDQAWLLRWISAPDQMLAQQDPIASELFKQFNNVPMPNLGLTETQVAALITYLGTQAEGASASQPVSAPVLAPGDPIIGKGLFMGVIRFQNGGPPCMACHTVAGIGTLGGGALGPDLTPAFNKYGETGLAAFLNTVPLLTMNAVWSRQPLTPEEQAHLRTFLQQASVAGRPIETTGQLALLAVAGTVILLTLAHFLWRRRLTGVRRPLLGRVS